MKSGLWFMHDNRVSVGPFAMIFFFFFCSKEEEILHMFSVST